MHNFKRRVALEIIVNIKFIHSFINEYYAHFRPPLWTAFSFLYCRHTNVNQYNHCYFSFSLVNAVFTALESLACNDAVVQVRDTVERRCGDGRSAPRR